MVNQAISSLAQISSKAELGHGVEVGPFTTIESGVRIGAGTVIGSHCLIGYAGAPNQELVIGPNSVIRSHSTFYLGSTFEGGLTTGHGVVVRDGITAGGHFQIGSGSHIEGASCFGTCVRTNTNVLIGRESNVGNFVHIAPNVSIYNDPLPPSNVHLGVEIGDLAVIAGSAIIFPGVKVGLGAFVASGSRVKNDVRDGECVQGNPAQAFAKINQLMNIENKLRGPWPDHFRRGYPTETLLLLDELVATLKQRISN
jgi:acyl-[acyl carrier protein]--UDP-N-acetylglucosamine O-acyltransferase